MKPLFLSFILALVSCGPSPIPTFYRVQFPSSPVLRTELLGECQWKLDYFDSNGNFCQKEIAKNSTVSVELRILGEWPSAILAWPYWPEKSLAAGYFYPAGAIFPLDIAGDTIILSWNAGAEAYFYWELEKAQEINSGTNRKPQFFDWKRFRTLLQETAPEELIKDPWLADWKDIAERTVRSGFRQSYVRAENRFSKEIIIPHTGPWLSASPFRSPEFWEEGEEVILFLSPRPEILVCPAGRFTISAAMQLWVLFP